MIPLQMWLSSFDFDREREIGRERETAREKGSQKTTKLNKLRQMSRKMALARKEGEMNRTSVTSEWILGANNWHVVDSTKSHQ